MRVECPGISTVHGVNEPILGFDDTELDGSNVNHAQWVFHVKCGGFPSRLPLPPVLPAVLVRIPDTAGCEPTVDLESGVGGDGHEAPASQVGEFCRAASVPLSVVNGALRAASQALPPDLLSSVSLTVAQQMIMDELENCMEQYRKATSDSLAFPFFKKDAPPSFVPAKPQPEYPDPHDYSI